MIIRKATISDCDIYFEWVNDSVVRKSAFKRDLIEWKNHKEWFADKINCKNSFLFIAENNQDKIGQVRFDYLNSISKIDYSISKEFRGKGYGKEILQKSIDKVISESKKIKKFEANVRIENVASRKIFSSLGFYELKKNNTFVTYFFDI